MSDCKIEAVLPLPKIINGQPLSQAFYQKLINDSHAIKEVVKKKVGRGYRETYIDIGECKCAIKGNLIYIGGNISHTPEAARYLRLAITPNDIFFLFDTQSSIVDQPNFTIKF